MRRGGGFHKGRSCFLQAALFFCVMAAP